MTNPTATELVEAVEAACKCDDGEGWDYPLIIERMTEIADGIDSIDDAPRLLADDVVWLRGLALVLAAALESTES